MRRRRKQKPDPADQLIVILAVVVFAALGVYWSISAVITLLRMQPFDTLCVLDHNGQQIEIPCHLHD